MPKQTFHERMQALLLRGPLHCASHSALVGVHQQGRNGGKGEKKIYCKNISKLYRMGLFDKIFGRKKEPEIQKTEQMNPNDIWFTLPTVSNEFPSTIGTNTVTSFDINLRSDDYRQNEFLPAYSIPLIEQEVEGIQNVWKNFSKKSGEYTLFKNCHVRTKIGEPELAIPFTELMTLLNVNDIGMVRIDDETLTNSFAFKTENTTYYGTATNDTITQLCILEWTEHTITEITAINSKYNLIFANWYNANIIQHQ